MFPLSDVRAPEEECVCTNQVKTNVGTSWFHLMWQTSYAPCWLGKKNKVVWCVTDNLQYDSVLKYQEDTE